MLQARFEIVHVPDARPDPFFGQSLEHFYVYKNCIVHGSIPLSSVIVFGAVHMHVMYVHNQNVIRCVFDRTHVPLSSSPLKLESESHTKGSKINDSTLSLSRYGR